MKTVKELMTGAVVTTAPEASLKDVAVLMREHDVGFVPVVGNEKVVGLITDRDLVTRGLADGLAADVRVRDIATPTVRTIHEEETLDTLADAMKAKNLRRFVVLDAEERPVGVVALGDVAHRGDAGTAGTVLKEISSPSKPMRVDERTAARPAFARIVAGDVEAR
ncbi:MAG TPA: CBS domain-containing protein [bacterium]|nr:CBS domain-containing protein [bacterium]